jgi:hypothetical protein
MPAFGKRNVQSKRTAFAPARSPDAEAAPPAGHDEESAMAEALVLAVRRRRRSWLPILAALALIYWIADLSLVFVAPGLVKSVLSHFAVGGGRSMWATDDKGMIPASEMPAREADAIAQSGTLTERYPHDPRGHFFRALYFLDAHDLADAEEHLRTALSEREALEADTSPEFQQVLRIVLAVTLVGESHDSEAKILSASDCRYAATRVDMAKGLELLQKAGVCA